MAHFFLADALARAAVGDRVSVRGAEARHAVTVSRLAVGEVVAIGNGVGLVTTGPIVSASPTELTIRVEAVEVAPAPAGGVVLVQALAKGDRDELAVQAATELGVDVVIPWAAARSIPRWEGAKRAKGRERWAAVAREASKQSLRAWVPEVLDIVTTRELALLAATTRMLVLEPAASKQFVDVVGAPTDDREPRDGNLSEQRDIVLVIGPEGGISGHELEMLTGAGADAVRLGAGVLRTSTAGPAAIAVLNGLLGRW